MGLIVTGLVFGMVIATLGVIAVVSGINKPGKVVEPGAAASAVVLLMLYMAAPLAMLALGYTGALAVVAIGWLAGTNAYQVGVVVHRVGKLHPAKPRTPGRALVALTGTLADIAALAYLLSLVLA